MVEAIKKASIRVPAKLWRKARVKALSQEMTLQDLISKLLEEYLEAR
jgi:predicted HicB family RNase H-like nuclease